MKKCIDLSIKKRRVSVAFGANFNPLFNTGKTMVHLKSKESQLKSNESDNQAINDKIEANLQRIVDLYKAYIKYSVM
jgi:hypothetical protein